MGERVFRSTFNVRADSWPQALEQVQAQVADIMGTRASITEAILCKSNLSVYTEVMQTALPVGLANRDVPELERWFQIEWTYVPGRHGV